MNPMSLSRSATKVQSKRGGPQLSVGIRDLLILDELQRSSNISQRALAARLGMAVGAVNRHLQDMIEAGHIAVTNRSVRPFAYRLTRCGKRYLRLLSHEHYSSVLSNLRLVERRISSALREQVRRDITRVVFYGAGDMMEAAYRLAKVVGVDVVGVVDDDGTKHGLLIEDGLVVKPPSAINELEPDAVVITTISGRHIR